MSNDAASNDAALNGSRHDLALIRYAMNLRPARTLGHLRFGLLARLPAGPPIRGVAMQCLKRQHASAAGRAQ
jgi:hypothetical protein